MKSYTLISNFIFYFIRIKNLKRINLISIFKLLRDAIIVFDHRHFIQTGRPKSNLLTAYTYFVLKGIWTGNRVHEHFDPLKYLNSYPKSPMKTSLPLLHYIAKSSGSNPITPFDRAYLSIHPELQNFEQALLVHFAKSYLSDERFIVPNLRADPNNYEIDVSLVNVKPCETYDFDSVDLRISCSSFIFMSDTDIFENKTHLSVKTSTAIVQQDRSSTLVETSINNGQLLIEIYSDKVVFLDIRWLRILVSQNQSINMNFDVVSLSNNLEFLLNSISSRLPEEFEVLGPEFSFSISSYKRDFKNSSLSKIHFKSGGFKQKNVKSNDHKLILLVSHEDSYSGAPLYLLQIAKFLKNLGFHVSILCLMAKHRDGVFIRAGFQTYYFEDLGQTTLFEKEWILNQRGEETVRSFFLNLVPDQIWINSIACSSLVDIAIELNFSVCFFVHESFGFENQDYLINNYEIMFQSALEKSHLVVFGSENSKMSFKRKNLHLNGIVLNSIKLSDTSQLITEPDASFRFRKELGIEQSARVYLSMATFEPRKRISDIVLAFKEANIPESFLILIGSLKNDPFSKKIARECRGSSNILVLPTVSNPEVYYQLSDVLIFASEEETYPLVLQEAIHWDLIRIVSRFPGYKESCDDGNSLLFNVGDIGSLRELIQESKHDSMVLNELRKNARLNLAQKEIYYKKELDKIVRNLSCINITLGEKI